MKYAKRTCRLAVVALALLACLGTIGARSAFGGPDVSLVSVTLASSGLSSGRHSGGAPAVGTVTMSGRAPAGDAVVLLSSSDPALAAVPATVTVAAGSTTATFPVTTFAVTTASSVTISATYAGVTKTTALQLWPSVLQSLTLAAPRVVAGAGATGTVALSGTAPSGGLALTLSSDNPAAASVPANVTVAAGTTSATFAITTSPVQSTTAVRLSASDGTTTQAATLTVLYVVPSAITLNPTQVTGGQPVVGRITLSDAPPASGLNVTASSSNPAAAAVPASVSVTAGATAAAFPVTTSPVGADASVDITVSYGGVTQTASLQVLAAALTGLMVSPTSLRSPGTATGTLTLNGAAPAAGAPISLSSSSPAVTVPASVAVPAGASSITFPVTPQPVATSVPVVISASRLGVTRTFPATVLPPVPPAAPSNLAVTLTATPQALLAWTDNSATETGFEIERRSDSGPFTRIATLLPDTTNFTDAGVVRNTRYTYQVRAVNLGGASAYSNPASISLVAGGAVEWFAATNGTPTGQGTLASPWNLQIALVGGPTGTQVQPGDTIWVRGGTYSGSFGSRVSGTAAAPVIVRNYQNERVILDNAGAPGPALDLRGSNVWIWGLEFTDSDPARITTVAGSFPPIHRQYNAVNVYGQHTKLINCVARDGGTGVGSWLQARDSEIYGCLIFNNGWRGPDRGHGHGLYLQNSNIPAAPSLKKVQETILFNNFGFGVQVYTTSGQATNILFDGVVAFNNSSPQAAYGRASLRTQNIYIASEDDGQTPSSITLQNVFAYHPSRASGTNLSISSTSSGRTSLSVSNLYVAGGNIGILLGRWWALSMTGLQLFGQGQAELVNIFAGETIPARWTWDNSTYYNLTALSGGVRYGYRCSGVYDPPLPGSEKNTYTLGFLRWKAGTGFDANSTEINAEPPNSVFVRRNAYEPGRGHVVVYNWSGAATVSVDLSTLGLADGQPFEIRNVQNYFGTPVLQGIYRAATPTVSLPLTDTTVASPVGYQAYPIASTLREFGAFVVVPH